MLRVSKAMSWYGFACAFADLKWPRVAATTRRTHAEALTAVTTAVVTSIRGQPNGKGSCRNYAAVARVVAPVMV